MLKQLVFAGVIGLVSAQTLHAQATAAPASTQPAKPATQMASAKPSHKATAEQIKSAQEALTKAGLYKGKVNGEWTKDLEASLKKYQTQNKLKVTGGLDEETMKKLVPAVPPGTATAQ
jgi:3-keto-L-gulonate-6-phosphate decarboxylase